MNNIIKKQKELIKQYGLVNKLNIKIQQINVELWQEIKNQLLKTKFIQITNQNKIKEFYYIHNILDNTEYYITGIKIDDKKQFEFGVLNIEHCKINEFNKIEPILFFKKTNKLKIDWDSNEIMQECFKYKPIEEIENDENKLPCVGYCRLSKDKNSTHKYSRQQIIINELANKDGYQVTEFFNEILSGVIPLNERKEMMSLIEYCQLCNVKDLYISEFNRLGRNTKTILEGIKFLRKNGIDTIHIALENIVINENYIKSNFKQLKELCRKAEEDRQNIVNRLNMGRNAFKERIKLGLETKTLGRKVGYRKTETDYKKQYYKDIELLMEGLSTVKVSTITGTSHGTVKRLKKMFINKHSENIE